MSLPVKTSKKKEKGSGILNPNTHWHRVFLEAEDFGVLNQTKAAH